MGNMEGRMLDFHDEKELCVANTWFRKGEKRKVTYSAGGDKLETLYWWEREIESI